MNKKNQTLNDNNQKIALRIVAMLMRLELSNDGYANANVSLHAKQARQHVEAMLRETGYTDREITDYWLNHRG